MPSRGKRLLNRYGRRKAYSPTINVKSLGRSLGKSRGRPYGKGVRNIEKYIINLLAVLTVIVLLFMLGKYFFGEQPKTFNVSAENIAAFQIPYKSLTILKNLSAKYKLDYIELLTIYSLENNFFPSKAVASTSEEIESKYILDYDTLKKQYKNSKIKPYYTLFQNLFDEIEYFPIPAGFDNEDTVSYMYGESFGAARDYGGQRTHEGCDIMDRENQRGRIPIVSMTAGTIEHIGWNELGGFRIGLFTQNGTYYYYAHMDSFAPNLVKGSKVKAGQLLGYMGDTGYGKKEGTKGNFQVHLHVGISPKTSLSKKEFWINPYPFLRYIENSKVTLT